MKAQFRWHSSQFMSSTCCFTVFQRADSGSVSERKRSSRTLKQGAERWSSLKTSLLYSELHSELPECPFPLPFCRANLLESFYAPLLHWQTSWEDSVGGLSFQFPLKNLHIHVSGNETPHLPVWLNALGKGGGSKKPSSSKDWSEVLAWVESP